MGPGGPGDLADPDTHIDGFQVFEILGRGGMGTVYRARQEYFDREVALKVVQPHLASDPDFTARFRSEMKHAAKIDHPNVVPVYAAGESDGSLYIAMKLIRGENLSKKLARSGRLTPEAAVGIVEQVASALDEAHDEGFVHRDVKPANILLEDETDRAYLSDFGIAKSLEATQSLTATGHGVGTIKYVAPEQIRGDDLDRRADVYSLGCVFYELLTGSLPFDEGSDAAILYAKINGETRVPGEVAPALSSWDSVLARALDPKPERRFGSAGQLAAAAGNALGGGSQAGLETEAIAGPDQTVALPLPVAPRRTEPRSPRQPRPAAALPASGSRAATASTRRLRLAAGRAVLVCALVIIGLLISRDGDDPGGNGESAADQVSAADKPKEKQQPEAEAEPSPAAPVPAETDEQPAVTTSPETRTLFETEVPEGWIPGQVDQPDAGRLTNTWVSPDDERVSILIDSQPAGEEEPSAIDSAASVREQTSGSDGYAELVFEETELGGVPAARWVFDLGDERKVDYFFYDCGIGIAVLGAAPSTEFESYEETFATVAESTVPDCEAAEAGGGKFKDNPGKAKGKDKNKDDDDDEGDD